jgi:hypothetical protein
LDIATGCSSANRQLRWEEFYFGKMVTIVNLASNQKPFIHPVRIATYYRILGLRLWRLGYLPRSEIHWRQPVLPRR